MQKLTEAMKFGPGYPDVLHPVAKQRIEGGEEPVEKLMPEPKDGEKSMEVIGSAAYRNAVDKVRKYTGVGPDNRGLFGQVMTVLGQCVRIENNRKAQLEKLAIDTVLEMPEFAPLKEMYEAGQIKIDAKITGDSLAVAGHNEEEQMQQEEDDQETKEEVDEVQEMIFQSLHDIDGAKLKRSFANAMTQGAAVGGFYMFEYVKSELDKIDRTLTNKYGVVMSIIHILYWITSQEVQSGQQGAAGTEEVEFDDNGVKTIRARGIIFPVLIHELIKGAMEVVSDESMSSNPRVRKEVFQSEDTVESEHIALLIGNELWKKFTSMFSPEETKLTLYVYNKLLSLPTEQEAEEGSTNFVEAIKNLLSDHPNGKQLIKQMIQEVKQELEDYEE